MPRLDLAAAWSTLDRLAPHADPALNLGLWRQAEAGAVEGWVQRRPKKPE